MFHDYLIYDAILAGFALIILCMAAVCDLKGAEIPDTLTLPIFSIGVSAAIIHHRWITILVADILLFLCIGHIKIPFLQKFNDYLMRKAYSEETLQTEDDTLRQQADAFHAKNGKYMDVCCAATILLMLFVYFGVAICQRETDRWIYIAGLFTFVFVSYLFLIAKVSATKGETIETEAISALGGADIIVFLGLLCFYGPVGFIYGMTATMGLALIVGLWQKCFRKDRIGIPLMPVILVAAPIRIYTAYSFIWMLDRDLLWAFKNLLGLR